MFSSLAGICCIAESQEVKTHKGQHIHVHHNFRAWISNSTLPEPIDSAYIFGNTELFWRWRIHVFVCYEQNWCWVSLSDAYHLISRDREQTKPEPHNLARLADHQTPGILQSQRFQWQGLQVFATIPKFFYMGSRRSNSGAHAYRRSILYRAVFPVLNFCMVIVKRHETPINYYHTIYLYWILMLNFITD